MGSGRAAARSNSARPPAVEPVNPMAFTNGWSTSAVAASRPSSTANSPCGAPTFSSASTTISAVRRPSLRCPPWILCRTAHPAARAEALSPPMTLKAKGKLEAPKTPTTPRGTLTRRMSGRGPIPQSGSAWSMTASRATPVRTSCANRSSWKALRLSSPRSRGSARWVSSAARPTSSSSWARRASARAVSQDARVAGVWAADTRYAWWAARAARSTSAAVVAGRITVFMESPREGSESAGVSWPQRASTSCQPAPEEKVQRSTEDRSISAPLPGRVGAW